MNGFELDLLNTRQAMFFTPDNALMYLPPNNTVWKDRMDLVMAMTTGMRKDSWRMRLRVLTDDDRPMVVRYMGTGSQQMGVKVEGVSMFDSGNWTLTMMNKNISVVSTRFQVVVTEQPHLVTDEVLPIEVEVGILFCAQHWIFVKFISLFRRKELLRSFLTLSVLNLTQRELTKLVFSPLILPTCG